MIYKKKPDTVEAIQWTGTNLYDVYVFLYGEDNRLLDITDDKWKEHTDIIKQVGLHISISEDSLENILVPIGYWILKTKSEDLSILSDEDFDNMYENL